MNSEAVAKRLDVTARTVHTTSLHAEPPPALAAQVGLRSPTSERGGHAHSRAQRSARMCVSALRIEADKLRHLLLTGAQRVIGKNAISFRSLA